MNEEIVANFTCCGKHMVVVKLEHGTHVLTIDEWKRIFGKNHFERWKTRRK